MDSKLHEEINVQINKELYSGYLYLSMAAYFDSQSLSGYAHWMKMQAQEEFLHANKFMDHLNDRGCRIILQAIDQPDVDFESVKDVFEKTLAHEKFVTSRINMLYKLASDLNDNAAKIMLEWFVTEQVEEEKNPSEILDKIVFLKEDPMSMLMLDKELMARPAPQTAAA